MFLPSRLLPVCFLDGTVFLSRFQIDRQTNLFDFLRPSCQSRGHGSQILTSFKLKLFWIAVLTMLQFHRNRLADRLISSIAQLDREGTSILCERTVRNLPEFLTVAVLLVIEHKNRSAKLYLSRNSGFLLDARSERTGFDVELVETRTMVVRMNRWRR